MIFENSWLNHTKEEISLNWLLSGLNDWVKNYPNYKLDTPLNILIQDIEREIKNIEKECPQCLKNRIKNLIKQGGK
jgi:hypothetical protein